MIGRFKVLILAGSVLFLFSFLVIFENQIAYAKPTEVLTNTMTRNECSLLGGYFAGDNLGNVLCCIEYEDKIVCSRCSDCTDDDLGPKERKRPSRPTGKIEELQKQETGPKGRKLKSRTGLDALRKAE